jgi:tetratricopeptide (TPR) repeat protein
MKRPMYCHYGNGRDNRQDLGKASRFGLILAVAALFLFSAHGAAAQDTSAAASGGGGDVWERAVEAVQNNRLAESIPLLEVVVAREPGNIEAIRMLAVAKEQTGDVAGAERLLAATAAEEELPDAARGIAAFDRAAVLSRMDRREEAVEAYTTALALDGDLAASYLNRANLRVALSSYEEAVRDYEFYLAIRPDARQRPRIEEMIALLRETIEAERIAREEEERLRREREAAERIAREEEARRLEEEAEAQRIAEEEARQAAETRRQLMLDSVLESLGSATEDATSFEAESEDIRSYDDEIDIMD